MKISNTIPAHQSVPEKDSPGCIASTVGSHFLDMPSSHDPNNARNDNQGSKWAYSVFGKFWKTGLNRHF